ncbi:twin-arginine translocation signal domain-containing protein (plasmid) [Paracoccus sp. AK26]|nr:twin-arginine translocation signal domain-containing protein [Paracoccus sp. AK26]
MLSARVARRDFMGNSCAGGAGATWRLALEG